MLPPIDKTGLTAYIYILTDPRTGKEFYVGKTKNPRARYHYHIKDTELRPNTKKSLWIKSLLDEGLKPKMEIVDQCLQSEEWRWKKLESIWIRFYKGVNPELLNEHDRSVGGDSVTSIKVSRSLKGRIVSIDTRKKISKARMNPAWRKANAHVFAGHKHTPEEIARIVKRQTGKVASEETRLKISLAHKGKKWSPEYREKMMKIRSLKRGEKRGPLSQEVKDAISRTKKLSFLAKAASILNGVSSVHPNPEPCDFGLKDYEAMALNIES